MTLFDWFLVGSGGVYLTAILWLLAGLCRRAPAVVADQPRVSVIVAARNEAETIGSCLQALQQQDYPGQVEIVVVDDRSEDGTGARVREQGGDQVKLVRAREELLFKCPKKSALAQGIAASSGELLLFTDADCQPPSGWVRAMVAHFAVDVGLVAGYAFPRSPRGWWPRLLALDNLAIGALSAGSIGMGHLLACTGRNLAYRRQVYEEVGGFGAIGHLIGGDDVYFARLVASRTNWKIVYNRDPEAAVPGDSGPASWRDMVQQKLRHAAKAGHYRGGALGLAGAVYGFHLALLAGLVQMVIWGQWNGLLLGVWGGRWVVDFMLLWVFARRCERGRLVFLPFLELCYIPYVLIFTAIGRLGWFRWKP